MSHFCVLVSGDYEHNLAPFHEFECTGEVDEFVVDVDITEDARSTYEGRDEEDRGGSFIEFVQGWYGSKPVVKPNETIDREDAHKWGFILVDENGEVEKVVDRTNPNAKWDGYVVGGRWRGSLLLKDGGRGDSALKSEIDFDVMRKMARDDAEAQWNKAQPTCDWLPFATIREMYPGDMDRARKEYWAQPGLAATKERNDADQMFWMFDYDEFLKGKEEYIASSAAKRFAPFAFVHERKWNQLGDMGWWGMSSNEMEGKEWGQIVDAWIDSLPDDTVITMIDCHI